jgi:hypothetical protein
MGNWTYPPALGAGTFASSSLAAPTITILTISFTIRYHHGMTTLIEKARAATYAHNSGILDRQAAAAAAMKLKRDQELSDAKVWALDQMADVQEKILEVSAKGKNSYYHPIADFEDRVSRLTLDRVQALSLLVSEEGFRTEQYGSVDKPCGSDSYFSHPVYSTSLIIRW